MARRVSRRATVRCAIELDHDPRCAPRRHCARSPARLGWRIMDSPLCAQRDHRGLTIGRVWCFAGNVSIHDHVAVTSTDLASISARIIGCSPTPRKRHDRIRPLDDTGQRREPPNCAIPQANIYFHAGNNEHRPNCTIPQGKPRIRGHVQDAKGTRKPSETGFSPLTPDAVKKLTDVLLSHEKLAAAGLPKWQLQSAAGQ